MTASSPSAYSVSVMIHGAFVAMVLVSAWVLKDQPLNKPTEVFELVAGEGDNWQATEATAYGRPDATGTTPIAPPSTPTPAPAPPATTRPPERSISQQMAQIAARRERQIVTQHRREEAARERREAAERAKAEKLAAQKEAADKAAADKAAAEQRKTMTKEEFDRLNPQRTPRSSSSSKQSSGPPPKIDTRGLATGVQGGTTAEAGSSGKAFSRAQQDRLGTYFALLKQKVKTAHVMPMGATDRLSARVSFHVSASGLISQVKIIRSSGNAEFDESVIAAFRAVGRMDDRRPDDRSDYRESEFNMSED